jgi:hypothetical protein
MQSIQQAIHPPVWTGSGNKPLLWAKRGIWLYFWLLILEGALRKWILPQLSAPLLLVRDPVVLLIYWHAYRSRRISTHGLAALALVSAAIVLLTFIQFVGGIDEPLTALYGVRSYLLYLPLIFVMKCVLTGDDVKQIGRWFLIISIPMTVLMIQQYRAPSGSWLNIGAGGESNVQLYFAGEHVRASGTFSFINGTSDFFPITAAFLLFGITQVGTYSNLLLSAAVIANIIALPISGSRTLFFSSAFVVACGVLSLLSSGRSFGRLIKVASGVLVAAVICSQLPVFRDSLASFADRWQSADQAEGGGGAQGVLQTRVLDTITAPFEMLVEVPLFGNGIGLGSNVAAAARTGSRDFLLAEAEWPRVVQECGPIFGLLFLGYRVLLCGTLISASLSLRHRTATLGLLLAAATVPQLLINTVEQPTNLGFMVFGAGLSLAAAKRRKMPPISLQMTSAPWHIEAPPPKPHIALS